LHRQAFACRAAGDRRQAEACFGEALEGFHNLMTTPGLRLAVEARAAMIPSKASQAKQITDDYLAALPRWLKDFHFEEFYAALLKCHVETAKGHWRLLERGSRLPAFAREFDLDLLREQVCQRLKVTRERLHESPDDENQVLMQAEQILVLDRRNTRARDLAIEGYTNQIQRMMDSISSSSSRKGKEVEAAAQLPAGKKRRLSALLRKSVRRLRRHLNTHRFAPASDIGIFVTGLQHLCLYYVGLGDYQTALRMIRRARHLQPDNDTLSRWARWVRKARRS
jgi:tetratricopeptide (TPR) repeat protein